MKFFTLFDCLCLSNKLAHFLKKLLVKHVLAEAYILLVSCNKHEIFFLLFLSPQVTLTPALLFGHLINLTLLLCISLSSLSLIGAIFFIPNSYLCLIFRPDYFYKQDMREMKSGIIKLIQCHKSITFNIHLCGFNFLITFCQYKFVQLKQKSKFISLKKDKNNLFYCIVSRMPDSLFTTRNRSFSQSSIRKRIMRSASQHIQQKQLTRNSTMTSFKPKLERLIQEGKVEQILNSDKHSKAKLLYSTTINDMEKQLAESKKSLSTMSLKAKSKQFSINKLKSEIVRLQKQREAIRANSEVINKLYDNTLSFLDSKKQTKENTEWVEKSYVHIKQRLVKDEYYHKLQYEARQRFMEAERLRAQFLEKKAMDINKERKELDSAVGEAKFITNEETYLKNELIDIINQDRQEKEFLNNLKIQKHQKEAEINQLSSWVIEKEELNKYLNILYTHRILGQIIRTKNTNLMKKYQEVQSAYMHIKSNTNIIEFQKILKKMEQQDSIYDITVKKVSDLQNQIDHIQKSIQKAKRAKHKILSQEGNLNKLEKDFYQGIEKDRYELLLSQKEKIEHRIVQDDILKQRVIEWGGRIRDKLEIFKTEGQRFEDILPICVDRLRGQQKRGKK